MGANTNGRNPNTPRKKSQRFNDATFINWSLTVEQKSKIKAWSPTFGEVDDLLSEVIQEGCKVSFGFDDYGQSFTCSIVPQASHKTNYGYILVGRGSTPLKAFKQVLYIHREIFGGDWSTYSKEGNIEELDD